MKIKFVNALQGLGNTITEFGPETYPLPNLGEHVILDNKTWMVNRIVTDYANEEVRYIVERVRN